MDARRGEKVDRAGEEAGPAVELARLRVTGVVQGVGFRWFVLEQARALGLTGTVGNQPDGSVVIAAAGPRRALVALVRHATRGPALARVAEVRVRWSRADRTWDDFRVIR